jgi:hypothetical protein
MEVQHCDGACASVTIKVARLTASECRGNPDRLPDSSVASVLRHLDPASDTNLVCQNFHRLLVMSESPPLAAHKWPGCIVMGIWSRNWSRSFQASANHTAAAQTFCRPRCFLECQSGMVSDVVSKVSTIVNQQCLSLHWERTLLCAVGSRRSIMIQKMLMFTQSRSAFNPETICSAEKLNRGSRRMCVRYSSSLCRYS